MAQILVSQFGEEAQQIADLIGRGYVICGMAGARHLGVIYGIEATAEVEIGNGLVSTLHEWE